MINVIIFDMDGLLVDSQPLQYQAYNQVFSKYGSPLTLDDWHEWIQNSYSPKQWIQKNKLSLDANIIRSEKKILYDELIRNKLTLKPGARNLINKLFGRFRLSVASASRIESVQLILNKFALESKFEELVSDTEMARGKPHPDIFLKTAEVMLAKVEECLVIEDSIAGLKAAKAAKMKCIICPDTFSTIPLSAFVDADKIVNDLDEIFVEMIENI